jgi:hypothetical protein
MSKVLNVERVKCRSIRSSKKRISRAEMSRNKMANEGIAKRKDGEVVKCRIRQKQKRTTIETKMTLTNGRYERVMTWSSLTGRCPVTVSHKAQTKCS